MLRRGESFSRNIETNIILIQSGFVYRDPYPPFPTIENPRNASINCDDKAVTVVKGVTQDEELTNRKILNFAKR